MADKSRQHSQRDDPPPSSNLSSTASAFTPADTPVGETAASLRPPQAPASAVTSRSKTPQGRRQLTASRAPQEAVSVPTQSRNNASDVKEDNVDELPKLKKKIDDLQASNSDYYRRIGDAQQDAEDRKAEADKLRKQNRELEDKLSFVTRERDNVLNEAERVREERALAEKSAGSASLLERDAQEHIKALKEALQNHVSELKDEEEKRKRLQDEVDDFQARIAALHQELDKLGKEREEAVQMANATMGAREQLEIINGIFEQEFKELGVGLPLDQYIQHFREQQQQNRLRRDNSQVDLRRDSSQVSLDNLDPALRVGGRPGGGGNRQVSTASLGDELKDVDEESGGETDHELDDQDPTITKPGDLSDQPGRDNGVVSGWKGLPKPVNIAQMPEQGTIIYGDTTPVFGEVIPGVLKAREEKFKKLRDDAVAAAASSNAQQQPPTIFGSTSTTFAPVLQDAANARNERFKKMREEEAADAELFSERPLPLDPAIIAERKRLKNNDEWTLIDLLQQMAKSDAMHQEEDDARKARIAELEKRIEDLGDDITGTAMQHGFEIDAKDVEIREQSDRIKSLETENADMLDAHDEEIESRNKHIKKLEAELNTLKQINGRKIITPKKISNRPKPDLGLSDITRVDTAPETTPHTPDAADNTNTAAHDAELKARDEHIQQLEHKLADELKKRDERIGKLEADLERTRKSDAEKAEEIKDRMLRGRQLDKDRIESDKNWNMRLQKLKDERAEALQKANSAHAEALKARDASIQKLEKDRVDDDKKWNIHLHKLEDERAEALRKVNSAHEDALKARDATIQELEADVEKVEAEHNKEIKARDDRIRKLDSDNRHLIDNWANAGKIKDTDERTRFMRLLKERLERIQELEGENRTLSKKLNDATREPLSPPLLGLSPIVGVNTPPGAELTRLPGAVTTSDQLIQTDTVEPPKPEIIYRDRDVVRTVKVDKTPDWFWWVLTALAGILVAGIFLTVGEANVWLDANDTTRQQVAAMTFGSSSGGLLGWVDAPPGIRLG